MKNRLRFLGVMVGVAAVWLAGCAAPSPDAGAAGRVNSATLPTAIAAGRYSNADAPIQGGPMVMDCETASQCISTVFQNGVAQGRPVSHRLTLADAQVTRASQAVARQLLADGGQVDKAVRLSAQDLAAVAPIAQSAGACRGDAAHDGMLVACPSVAQGQPALVIFMQGLCDRCAMAAFVLKKAP